MLFAQNSPCPQTTPTPTPSSSRHSASAGLHGAGRADLSIRARSSLSRLAARNALVQIANTRNAQQASIIDGGGVYLVLT
jgi:hypothetical protein